MKLIIEIPAEFESHFMYDKFEDSLRRLESDAHLLAGMYEKETAAMLITAFKHSVTIPPHGDLVDKDTLKYYFDEIRRALQQNGEERSLLWRCFEDMVNYSPVVIPADNRGSEH